MVLENSFYERLGDASSASDDIRKLISVLTAHKIALWEYDIPTGNCFFSPDYFKILGLDKMGINFTTVEESYPFIHPNDLPRYKNFFEHLLRTHTKSAKLSYRYVGPRGGSVWMEDHFLFYGKHGTPDEIIVYSVDVTNRREKELQLIKVTEYNKKVLDAMPEFMFIFDDDFHIVDVLKSSYTELLHSVDELKGIDARHIYSSEVSDLFIANIHECLYTQSLREIQYPLEKDGQTFYFEARLSPFGDGKVLALIRDIGDRVRRNNDLMDAKRRAEEADRMKNLFLANMSHEIRTPLNSIVGFSEILLLDGATAEEREEYLSIIGRNSELLLRLIDDILDLSRIEAGKEEMIFCETDLNKLVEQVGVSMEMKVPSHLQFDVLLPSEELRIYTDYNRLTQILTNFLSNSLKNTAEGTITLGLAREGDMIKVYVSDTGCGIPKEKHDLIFQRFEKLDDFKQGTGLGLSICKHLSERLGGKITLESELGKGSTFSLYLHESPMKGSEGGYLHSKKKILVVEDSEENYLQLDNVLGKVYSLMRTRTGKDTVRAILTDKPDLLMINMGIVSEQAIDVIEQVRNIYPTLLIVAIIETGHYSLRQRAFQAGCKEIIVKPYSADRLRAMVKVLLGA